MKTVIEVEDGIVTAVYADGDPEQQVDVVYVDTVVEGTEDADEAVAYRTEEILTEPLGAAKSLVDAAIRDTDRSLQQLHDLREGLG